jgi:hypothetical protein
MLLEPTTANLRPISDRFLQVKKAKNVACLLEATTQKCSSFFIRVVFSVEDINIPNMKFALCLSSLCPLWRFLSINSQKRFSSYIFFRASFLTLLYMTYDIRHRPSIFWCVHANIRKEHHLLAWTYNHQLKLAMFYSRKRSFWMVKFCMI